MLLQGLNTIGCFISSKIESLGATNERGGRGQYLDVVIRTCGVNILPVVPDPDPRIPPWLAFMFTALMARLVAILVYRLAFNHV
jgi:hypothetical protein